jgi:hypothetical protein
MLCYVMHNGPTRNQAAVPSAVQPLPFDCSGCSVITGLGVLLQESSKRAAGGGAQHAARQAAGAWHELVNRQAAGPCEV